MRKIVLTLMASLLSCSAASAFWPEATDSSLEVGVGYRQDRLEWKTSSKFNSCYDQCSTNYNDNCGDAFCNDEFLCNDDCLGNLPGRVNSHLKWKDLNIWQIEIKGKYVTCDNVYFRFNGDYGWVTSGKNTDTDNFDRGYGCGDYNDCGDNFFSGNNNYTQNGRSHSKTKGNVYDFRLALGYQFKLCDDSFSIAPLIGYSWHGQHLKDHHLRQRCACSDDCNFNDNCSFDQESCSRSRSSSCESFSSVSVASCDSSSSYDSCSYGGNHSTYHARWNGPFIGFDFDWRFGCCCEWDIFGTYEFHWADYNAKAKWNLRTDLKDGFHHHAKTAYGSIFDIGVKWDFCECWTLAVKGEFQWFWADKGHDRAKIAEGRCGNVREKCFLSIPLKDIKWQSAGISVDVGMVF